MEIVIERAEKWFRYSDDESYLVRYTPQEVMNQASRGENPMAAMVSDIVADWKGLTLNGDEFTCTEENRKLFAMSQTGMKRVSWLMQKAMDIGAFMELEDTLKNLSGRRNGG